jgi:hypothetical protein
VMDGDLENTSYDRSRYMILQPHPLAFVWLILVGFSL